MTPSTLLLSDRDVASCLAALDPAEAVRLVEEVFRAHGQARAVMPPKVHLDLASHGLRGWMNAMPAYLSPGGVMGLKWIGGFDGNPARGLPYLVGIIVLADAQTGHFLAIMEGAQITSVRTGAAAAVAAKYLANAGPQTVALIGAGVQGSAVLRSLESVLDITDLRVVDIDRAKREAMAVRFRQDSSRRAAGVESAHDAVDGAGVIITATTSETPLVYESWVRAGALVITLGSLPEVEAALVASVDKVVVDNWAQAAHRGGLRPLAEEGLLTRESIYAELGDVVAGKTPGRENSLERILCAEVGMGTEDLAMATYVYETARQAQLGQEVRLHAD